MRAQLELRLLGKPQVYLDGQAVTGFRTAKVEALLYYLAISRQFHSRESLATLPAALSWPDDCWRWNRGAKRPTTN